MNRPIMKELDLTPHEGDLEAVAILLDCLEMTKVKTKYAKTGWDAISLHGYGPDPEDILKPGVLKSSVDIDTKLQWTTLKDNAIIPIFSSMCVIASCNCSRLNSFFL